MYSVGDSVRHNDVNKVITRMDNSSIPYQLTDSNGITSWASRENAQLIEAGIAIVGSYRAGVEVTYEGNTCIVLRETILGVCIKEPNGDHRLVPIHDLIVDAPYKEIDAVFTRGYTTWEGTTLKLIPFTDQLLHAAQAPPELLEAWKEYVGGEV